jgi:hypothetical protein
MVAAPPPAPPPAQLTPPTQATPPVTPPAQVTPPAAPPAAPPAQATPPVTPPAQATPPATPPAANVPETLRVILTPPGAPMTLAGQPATVPISVFGASRVSTVTLSLRYDPKVLRVRLVQEGTFLASSGGSVTFAQQVDAASGRVDITLTRVGDTVGASGDGVLATVVFDAAGAGVSPLGLGGVVTGPGGLPVPVQFGGGAITVR